MIYVEGGTQVDAVPDGPSISALSPAAGPTGGGQSVTVEGAGFQPGMTATIGGVAVTPSGVTATSFTFTTPAATAGYVQMQVADALGTSALTAGAGYIYANLAGYVPVTPFRILDTRPRGCIQCGAGALGPGVTRTLQITGVSGLPSDTIPSTATAVVVNVTAVNDNSFSLLTVYPTGTGRPRASNLNFPAHSCDGQPGDRHPRAEHSVGCQS